jgi:hypothetical protein
MTTHSENEEWLFIAEQASKEMDPAKLVSLVEQLCSALDDRQKAASPLTNQTNPRNAR